MPILEAKIDYKLDEWPSVAKIDQYITSVLLEYIDKVDNDVYNGVPNLNTHANIIVCDKFCWVSADSRFKDDVTAISDVVGKILEVSIINSLILYENPLT